MFKKIFYIFIVLLFFCSNNFKNYYIGKISNFEIHRGSFNTSDISIVELENGDKYTVYDINIRTGLCLYKIIYSNGRSYYYVGDCCNECN